jgi:hypothetical protein
MASGAPIARWWKPLACQSSNAARAACRRCWWASSSTCAPLARAAHVVVPRQLVDELGPLHELAELEHEQTGALAVRQQDADGLVLLDDRLERPDGRRVVDHHL